MMKDDEMTSDVYNSKFTDRVKYVREALEKAKEKTGKMPIYLCSSPTRPAKSMIKRASWSRSVEMVS